MEDYNIVFSLTFTLLTYFKTKQYNGTLVFRPIK